MNRLIKYLTLAAAVAGLAATARALPIITGGVSLAGGYTVNSGGDLNTATAFLSFTDVFVTSRSGSFITAGVGVGSTSPAITMTPFSWGTFVGVSPLWITTTGPLASFDFTSLTSVMQTGNDALELRGLGTLHLVGYDATPGSYLFTANQGGGTFSFSSSNAAVPDGGTTALLLGAGLTGLALISRRQKRKS